MACPPWKIEKNEEEDSKRSVTSFSPIKVPGIKKKAIQEIAAMLMLEKRPLCFVMFSRGKEFQRRFPGDSTSAVRAGFFVPTAFLQRNLLWFAISPLS
jgi:hypothetical protein